MTAQRAMLRLGWLLFLVGSLVFLGDAMARGDVVTMIGSAMFVAGVLAFMIAERSPSPGKPEAYPPRPPRTRDGGVGWARQGSGVRQACQKVI
jgi:hypothetical protein